MTNAIRASTEWNPNATRVRDADLVTEVVEGVEAAAGCPGQPPADGFDAGVGSVAVTQRDQGAQARVPLPRALGNLR